MLSVGSQIAYQSPWVLTPMLSPARNLLLGLPPFESDWVSVVVDGPRIRSHSGRLSSAVRRRPDEFPGSIGTKRLACLGHAEFGRGHPCAGQPERRCDSDPTPAARKPGLLFRSNGNMLALGVTPRPLFSVHIGLMINPISRREFLGDPS
jgi:hypothetical protein